VIPSIKLKVVIFFTLALKITPQDLKGVITTKLRREVFENAYTKGRCPRLLFGFNNSQHKTGKQISSNLCGGVLSQVKVPWTNRILSKDQIRTLLKASYYPPDFIHFIF